MISPQMLFRKNIQLSISELKQAKAFAHQVNECFVEIVKDSFPEELFNISFKKLENGNLVHTVSNEAFEGVFEIVVGWDQKNIDGQIQKFMALNTSGKGESRSFKTREPSIQKLPDKGYYGGALSGGLIGFAICMWYAYESDDINMIMFFIVMLVTGWLGMKIGSILGSYLQNKAYDKAQSQAMSNELFLKSSGPWLAFSEKVNLKLDEILTSEHTTFEE